MKNMTNFVKKTVALLLGIIIIALSVGCNSATQQTVASSVLSDTISASDEPAASSDAETESTQEPSSSQAASSEEAAPPKPRVVVINGYSPYQKQSYAAGATIDVIVAARPDCTKVTATFGGQVIKLAKQGATANPEFYNFTAKITLPTGNEENLNLGKIKYYAEWQGNSETYYSPTITCLRDPQCDRTTVVEVVAESAETFDGNTTNDNSDPRLSPLPKGTVDYKVGGVVYDKESDKYYYNLRCGRRVYVDKPNPPNTAKYQVTKIYKGELPDSNQISLNATSVSGGYTYITFDTAWKAPFAVTVGPQQYGNPSRRDFTVQSFTANYVDIKFYYASVIGGNVVLPDNPLFRHAEAIPQAGGAVLRLHFKKAAGFYGWDAYYNSARQLEFKFLNPKGAIAASNKYGADLTGITVMLDAGHGGRDPGALGAGGVNEAERNLALTYKIKAELESIGATVLLTRGSNTALSAEARCSMMRKKAPDLCVSIHHNSAVRASASGADFYCFNAYSNSATQSLYAKTLNAGIYKKVGKGWHYFYMGRVTSCPLVLIENGYMSNAFDLSTVTSDEINNKKAYNITLGIANYFLSIK